MNRLTRDFLYIRKVTNGEFLIFAVGINVAFILLRPGKRTRFSPADFFRTEQPWRTVVRGLDLVGSGMLIIIASVFVELISERLFLVHLGMYAVSLFLLLRSVKCFMTLER